jgi:hypothetical protein
MREENKRRERDSSVPQSKHGHAEGHARDRVRGGHHAFERVMPSTAKSGTCTHEKQHKWIMNEDSHTEHPLIKRLEGGVMTKIRCAA